MLFNQALKTFLKSASAAQQLARRNMGLTAVAFNKVDPIQRIFLEKVGGEYQNLSKIFMLF